MPVLAIHPAVVVRIPKGGRKERLDVVRCVTPVRLRDEDPGAFRPLAPIGTDARLAPLDVSLHGDALWSPVRVWAGGASRPASLGEFIAFLEGGEDAASGDIARSLAGTPLVACSLGHAGSPIGPREPTRGEPVDVESSREVPRDGRADAASDLATFLDGGFRVAGDVPMLRRAPLALAGGMPGQPQAVLRITDGAVPNGYRTAIAVPASFAGVEALLARGRMAMPPGTRDLAAWRTLIPEPALEGADVRAAVNGYPCHLRQDLREIAADERLDGHGRAEAARLAAGMEAMEILALTGSAHRAGEAEALAAVAEAVAAVIRLRPARSADRGQRFLAAFLAKVLLPRSEAGRREDLDALGDLAF